MKGLGVTLRRCSARQVTVQYPHVKEAPPRRARASSPCGRRTARSACSAPGPAPTGASTSRATRRNAPPRREGGKPRTVNVLDRFDIDYALCMYCGICVEVCPFDALFWTPEYEYSEPRIADLLHDKDQARRVDGDRAEPLARGRRGEGRSNRWSPRTSSSAFSPRSWSSRRCGGDHPERRAGRAVAGRRAGRGGGQYLLLAAEFVAVQILVYIGAMSCCSSSAPCSPRSQIGRETDLDNDQKAPARTSRCSCSASSAWSSWTRRGTTSCPDACRAPPRRSATRSSGRT